MASEYTSAATTSPRVGEMLAGAAAEAHGGYTVPSQADIVGSQMRQCCCTIVELRKELIRCQARHELAVARIAVIKARELVHGEYGDRQIIELKPLTVQEAVLLLSLGKNEEYLALAQSDETWRADVQAAEAELEYHRNRLAALRSQARLAAAEMEATKCS